MSEQAAQPQWTVRSMLAWAREWLKKKGVESPRLDAELLLAEALQCDRIRLYVDHDKPLSAEELLRFKELIQRRATREPVAYILGKKEFYGRTFAVDKRAFVPRPETELLVLAALQALDKRALHGEGLRALDLCTGTGIIGVTLAAEREKLAVELVELSPETAEVAKANAEKHAAGRATVLLGDLFAPLTPGARYDAICSNPPYVAAREQSRLAPEITQHEPALALYSGADGLDCIRKLVAEAPRWLSPGGSLFVEIDPTQSRTVIELCSRAGLLDARVAPDLAGLDRVLSARVP